MANNSFISNLTNIAAKKLNIKNLFHKNDNIIFTLQDTMSLDTNEIICVLKNTKTRVEYICPIILENSKFIINLEKCKDFFTDYEGNLYIISINQTTYTAYTPILKSRDFTTYIDTVNIDKKNLQWYLRVLENGEIRLSTVSKK